MRIESNGLHQANASSQSSPNHAAILKLSGISKAALKSAAPGPEELYAMWAPADGEAARTEALAQKLNEQLRLVGEDLHFKVHEKTGRVVVQVVDEKTQEVRRELPPEQLLDVMASLAEASGLRLDRTL